MKVMICNTRSLLAGKRLTEARPPLAWTGTPSLRDPQAYKKILRMYATALPDVFLEPDKDNIWDVNRPETERRSSD